MISVVIPTLDAGAMLARTLDELRSARERGLVREIIVSDGGSRDATLDLARRRGCTLVEGQAGRGTQLASGAGLASSPWLLFLHADTCLSPDWTEAVQTFLGRPDASARAAVFTFALDDPSSKARLLERIVSARTRYVGLPYGDQGLLVSRELYAALGGFRPMPLMEDVDLISRIGRGRIEMLGARAVTSASRYQRDGYARRMLRNGACLALYFAGVSPRVIARLYG
jgi:rSAM/selenodomain-associated transferase 2